MKPTTLVNASISVKRFTMPKSWLCALQHRKNVFFNDSFPSLGSALLCPDGVVIDTCRVSTCQWAQAQSADAATDFGSNAPCTGEGPSGELSKQEV